MSSLVFVTAFPLKWSWIVAIILGACHETFLGLGLSEWILDYNETDRSNDDLVSANREGIVSGEFSYQIMNFFISDYISIK